MYQLYNVKQEYENIFISNQLYYVSEHFFITNVNINQYIYWFCYDFGYSNTLSDSPESVFISFMNSKRNSCIPIIIENVIPHSFSQLIYLLKVIPNLM